MYDKPDNETFINKIEKAQYDAALAITGAIRGTSQENFYAELDIEFFINLCDGLEIGSFL